MENQESGQQSVFLPHSPELSAAVVAQRCREDADFRERLKKDPKATIFEGQEKQPWDEMKVVVHENTLDCWHVSIPSDRQIESMNKLRAMQEKAAEHELTDEQLQDLSGGEIGFSLAALIAVGVGIGAGIGTAGAVAVGVGVAAARGDF